MSNDYEFTPLTGSEDERVRPMDPRLQRALAMRQHGESRRASASTSVGEIAVVAMVSDVDAWRNHSDIVAGPAIGGTAEDGTTVVTGRVPVARLETVRSLPFVISMKAPRRVDRQLTETTREILARAADLPIETKVKDGKGVIVGVVDFGCDFAHSNLRKTNGKTRLLKLWDQGGNGSGEGVYSYGRMYRPARINAALTKPDPYDDLGYGPDPSEPAHGTHVSDIAVGNGLGTGNPGVAPGAGLVFVELASSDIPWGGAAAVGKSFGDSVQLLEALAWIFETAGTTPCVINVSLGTNGGPHDGSTLVEQGIDRLVTQAPNRTVVIAASNSFADGIHAAGTVPGKDTCDVAWTIAPGDQTENELELWYPKAGKLSVELIAPDGNSVGTVGPDASGTVSRNGKVLLFVANRLHDPNNGDNMIGVFMSAAAPKGTWTLRLESLGEKAVDFHAWIERDDGGQSTFGPAADNTHTVGSISCGHESIVVGSYDAHVAKAPLSWFSSEGPTRDGREKPDVSAPGHNVVAAASRTGNGSTRMSGTSMAAPAVTGAIALMLAEAKRRKHSLTSAQIRAAVIGEARRKPPPKTAWHARYGNGRITAAGLMKHV
jgi:subtilisin family serine protease